MEQESVKIIMIPETELISIKNVQEEILRQIRDLSSKGPGGLPIRNITAKEFMAAVRIGRSKFDQLVQYNKIRVIKKRRKIYVPIAEVDRYFNDTNIL